MDINGLANNMSVMAGMMQQPQQNPESIQQPAKDGSQGQANQALNTVGSVQNGDQAAEEQGKGLNLNLKI